MTLLQPVGMFIWASFTKEMLQTMQPDLHENTLTDQYLVGHQNASSHSETGSLISWSAAL
jgi:hypothetical protein